MTNYYIETEKNNILKIKVEFSSTQKKHIIKIPTWRPGRYEINNFSKDILEINFFKNNKKIKSKKTTKNSWEIKSKVGSYIHFIYRLQTYSIDAGSSFCDKKQIYINPVNSLMYIKNLEDSIHKIKFVNIDNFKIISSLKTANNLLLAKNYQQLADSPMVYTKNYIELNYKVNSIKFNIYFIGLETIDNKQKIIDDFRKFTEVQYKIFNSFPFKSYSFIIQALDYEFYHGVEHLESTVVALGPKKNILKNKPKSLGNYNNLIGVCSHELFHAWNVKTIRAKKFVNYNFDKENYTNLTYLAEGATTYYGDKTLKTSGFFNDKSYLKELSRIIQNHKYFYSDTRFSLSESAFDVWLDGYKGVYNYPKRYSIYIQGSIFFLGLDVEIRKVSNNKYSLDTVMKNIYEKFKSNGISQKNIENEVENIIGKERTKSYFKKYFWSYNNYFKLINNSLKYLNLKLNSKKNSCIVKSKLGIICKRNQCKQIVISYLDKNSPLLKKGATKGAVIKMKNNNYKLFKNNLKKQIDKNKDVKINIIVNNKNTEIKLNSSYLLSNNFFEEFYISKIKTKNKINFENFFYSHY